MDEVMRRIGELGVVPVAVFEKEGDAVPTAEALIRGGLPCVEVTFRTEAAEGAIREIASQCPQMLVGAGTVLTADQARRAVDAGAKFVVSPGYDEELIDVCRNWKVPVLPGCVTPTEVMRGIKDGFSVLKCFPAAQCGGPDYLRALGSVFRQVRFIPTGGIHGSNLREYLSCGCVLACGGSWMVKGSLIAAGRFDEVERLASEAVAIVREVRDGKEI